MPAEANLSSCVLPPATAISKSFPDAVTVRFESSVPSIETVVPSIAMPAVTSMSKTPASICTSEAASALASMWNARPDVWAEANLMCPSAEVVAISISSAASILIVS